jgi:hypothetical protein
MRQEGAFIVDGKEVADTMRCCHCGIHFVVQRGSGVKRGFCMGCNHVTCGGPRCWDHVPFEKKLDLHEKTRGRYPLP